MKRSTPFIFLLLIIGYTATAQSGPRSTSGYLNPILLRNPIPEVDYELAYTKVQIVSKCDPLKTETASIKKPLPLPAQVSKDQYDFWELKSPGRSASQSAFNEEENRLKPDFDSDELIPKSRTAKKSLSRGLKRKQVKVLKAEVDPIIL